MNTGHAQHINEEGIYGKYEINNLDIKEIYAHWFSFTSCENDRAEH